MERGFLNVTESAALHGKRTVSALAKEIKGYSTARNFKSTILNPEIIIWNGIFHSYQHSFFLLSDRLGSVSRSENRDYHDTKSIRDCLLPII